MNNNRITANRNETSVKAQIRGKIEELAKALGRDAGTLKDDDCIPQTGLLDSASLMMLIVWYETQFDISTDDEEPTIDNFGSIDLMADYLERNG
jgi:D-alanine--poly(phosphoribitol) ligase subunit 2